MRYLLATMSSLVLLASARGGNAAISVVEVGAQLVASEISAVQNTITAAQSILQVAHWVLEQTPLDELTMATEAMADLEALEALVRDARGLSWDLAGIAAYFDRWFSPANEPSSSAEWWVRQSDFQHLVREGYRYAMQTQTLIQSVARTARRLIAFADRIRGIIGNLQGSQQLADADHKLAQLLSEAQVRGRPMSASSRWRAPTTRSARRRCTTSTCGGSPTTRAGRG
jgi:conjugal transfer/entry exclusion protein